MHFQLFLFAISRYFDTQKNQTYKEAPIDAGRQKVLGSIPRDRAVVPRVLLKRVDRRHVVRRHPADATSQTMRLAPFAAFIVRYYADLLPCESDK